MASNALQVLYSTIDMIIVGAYVDTPGLSAVSQSSQILNFATMVCLGFCNGGLRLRHPGHDLLPVRQVEKAPRSGGGYISKELNHKVQLRPLTNPPFCDGGF